MASFMSRLFGNLKLPGMRPFKEMGARGTAVWGGYVQSIERSSSWSGRQRYITSSEILSNVSIVAASVHYFLNVVSRPSWKVVPASDDPESQKYAEFVEEVIDGLETPWPRIIRRATSYRFHGYSLQEWTALRRDDGKIGLVDIEARPQHTIEQWVLDPKTGKVTGVFQRAPQTNQLLGLPRNKLIYLLDDSMTDSPEGLGAFRHMAEPYNRLKQFLTLETRAFERDLRGTPIGRAPLTLINEAKDKGELTDEEANTLIRGMQDFIEAQVKQSDTGMLLDSMPYESEAQDGRKVSGNPQWNMELLQGSSNGLPELHAAIDRVQREMARILGTESLMLGESAGSRALSQDKSRNLYLSANSILEDETAAYTKDMIGPLWLLNAFPDEHKPWFQAEDVTPQDVEQVTAALRDMATAGAVLAPDDPVIDDVRDLLGVTRQPERDEADLDLMVRSKTGLQSAEQMERELAGENDNEKKKEIVGKLRSMLEKYDPNQPRAPKGSSTGGQWIAGGGAILPSDVRTNPSPEHVRHHPEGDATQLFNEQWDPYTEEQFMATMPPEVRQKIEWAEGEIAKGTRTTALVEEGGYMLPNGKWTTERQLLHEQILDTFFSEEAVARATPENGIPEFVMLGGRPGAGKSTALKMGDFKIDLSQYIVVAADDFQAMLPGYQPHLASLYNQEGQHLAELAERIARKNKLNIVFDATMKSTLPAMQRTYELQAEGYKVAAFFVHTTPETSARRAMTIRFASGDRYVPAKVLLSGISNEQTFDRVRPLVDRWALYDGNQDGKARLIAQGSK